MITIAEYINWCNKERKKKYESGLHKSEIKFLFNLDYYGNYSEHSQFNEDNWAGGDILRYYLIDNFDEINSNNFIYKKHYCIDDQTTILLLEKNGWYEISWYKSRGCTERIKKDGEPITLGEYIELCNLLKIELKY